MSSSFGWRESHCLWWGALESQVSKWNGSETSTYMNRVSMILTVVAGNIATARFLLRSQLDLSLSFTQLLTALLISDSLCILLTFVVFTAPKFAMVYRWTRIIFFNGFHMLKFEINFTFVCPSSFVQINFNRSSPYERHHQF